MAEADSALEQTVGADFTAGGYPLTTTDTAAAGADPDLQPLNPLP